MDAQLAEARAGEHESARQFEDEFGPGNEAVNMEEDLEEDQLLAAFPGLAKQRHESAVAQEAYRKMLDEAKLQQKADAAKTAAEAAAGAAEEAAKAKRERFVAAKVEASSSPTFSDSSPGAAGRAGDAGGEEATREPSRAPPPPPAARGDGAEEKATGGVCWTEYEGGGRVRSRSPREREGARTSPPAGNTDNTPGPEARRSKSRTPSRPGESSNASHAA